MDMQRKSPARAVIETISVEPLLDTDEAAAVLRIHPKTLQRLARRGEIQGLRYGKLWRFRRSDLTEKVA